MPLPNDELILSIHFGLGSKSYRLVVGEYGLQEGVDDLPGAINMFLGTADTLDRPELRKIYNGLANGLLANGCFTPFAQEEIQSVFNELRSQFQFDEP